MSSELIDLEENLDGQDITLEMNVHNHAWLAIHSINNTESYHLTPGPDGIRRAEAIIVGLQNWIEHVKKASYILVDNEEEFIKSVS